MPEPSLTNFLLDRIAEDEAMAQAVTHETAMAEGRYSWASVDFNDIANAEHGRRWDPARVLAECETKRRIVEWLPEDDVLGDGWHTGWNKGHKYAMQLLALPYADHPDYDETWRPE